METKCACGNKPSIFERDEKFVRGLVEVGKKSHGWIKLCKCSSCSQYWQVDEYDKLQTCLVIKIDNASVWNDFDDKEKRISFLIQSRGGFSGEKCNYAGCNGQSLKGLAFCPRCAFEKSSLRK